jgi:putative transposase
MLKTFKYRLRPTKKQINIMEHTLDECRWLYNYFLEQRKTSWEEKKESLNYHTQAVSIVKLKTDRPTLSNVHSQVLQNVAVRADLAFKAFFRRAKADEKPGYPRFKGEGRYDSFTFPQTGFEITNDGLKLSKIGILKIKLHRSIQGNIKTCIIKRSSTDKWYATFSCEVKPKPFRRVKKVIGIDVGIETFATFSTGEKIPNPRFFRQEEKTLAKAQKKLSNQDKGTPKRTKARKVVAHIHERITNKRKDFAHKLSRKIVNTYQVIALEKLNIKDMRENGFKDIRKSIGDVAWNQFIQFTVYKAEEAGRTVAFVDPRNTSKMCSRCGQIVEKKLSDRIHHCHSCGLSLNRDLNASYNILRLGIQSLGFALEALSNL